MSDDRRVVFGIAGERRDQSFAFISVLATVEGDRLCPVSRPEQEFPTAGDFYVEQRTGIPETGLPGIWTVMRKGNRTIVPGKRQAEYSAVEKSPAIPLEIVPIPILASQTDDLRDYITKGTRLSHPVASKVLLRTSDRYLLGPLGVSVTAGEPALRCTGEAFMEPLGVWPPSAEFPTVRFHWKQFKEREFAAVLEPPVPPEMRDFAPFSDVVHSVVKFVASLNSHGLELTRRQIDDLEGVLTHEAVPKRIALRVGRVMAALKTVGDSKDKLLAARELLLEDPVIQRELAAIRQETKEQETRTFKERAVEERHKLESLQAQSRKVRLDVESRLRELQDVDRRGTEALGRLVDELSSRLTSTKPAVAPASFAAAALLGAIGDSRARARSIVPKIETLTSSRTTLRSPSDAMLLLSQALTEAGLSGASARPLARELFATLLIGQVPMFSGAIAGHLARACARALSGTTMVVPIPVGLLSPDDLAGCIDDASRSAGSIVAVVLEGMNRSALDAYGDSLREMVCARVLNGTDAHRKLLLFGSLVDGAAALPLSTGHFDLGPVFDTSLLTPAPRPTTHQAAAAALDADLWTEWRVANVEHGLPDELAPWFQLLAREDSVLWRRGTGTAYCTLGRLGAAPLTPLQSVMLGWIAPRALASDGSLDSIREELGDGRLDAAEPDPRLTRFIRANPPASR